MSSIKTERILNNPAIAIEHGGDGQLLVFMHGIGGNRSNWTDQLQFFARDYHVLAWDSRGYGDSDDYEGPLDFSDFSDDLAKVLDHFDVPAAHICGLSMGGRIAQDFYARFPNRVKTLILVSTFSGFDNFTDTQKQRFIDLRKKPLVEEGKEPKDIAPTVAKTLLGPEASGAVYDRLVESMEVLHKESYIKTIEATTVYDRSVELNKIEVPTLLIYGENDRLTPAKLGQQMAEQISGCEYTRIPRCGHLVNLEKPTLFNECLADFLSRNSAG